MGLGRARGQNAVTLAEARDKAGTLYRMVKDGLDPLAERDKAEIVRKVKAEAATRYATTFKDVAEDYIATHSAAWGNPKHKAQWTAVLTAYPYMGDVPVADLTLSQMKTDPLLDSIRDTKRFKDVERQMNFPP